ncbi:hypothetical protein [Vulcanisaeta souniana]|uniref:Uncharacterized protein n=1 Tax=Vulcanisaeta souniana JCM 11219 TaxID=1293586 RepID=A0A830EE81_9CREN|nr:hypothetical protein [Vulcanisaeta souniana]BDR92045.1 hypothetical protein Vsou_11380 [Vulcanisaeta souniana JCM 11219]GGI68341.1 hypothetical protein GCM10007112_01690 [Vulcanisaeta souniana JCM 11219]
MALDRLIAETMLLIGSIYLGYVLFTVLGHMTPVLSLTNSMNQMASASIYVPDAVIVSNETGNQLYLVIYNNGRIPITLREVYIENQGNSTPIDIGNVYLTPGNYIVLHYETHYTQCRVNIVFCVANTTICMMYDTNTTQYVIS